MCNTKWRLQSTFLTQFKTKLKLRLPLVALLSVLLCFCLTLLCSYLNAHLEVSQGAKAVFIRLAFSWYSSRYQLGAGWHVPLLCKVEGRNVWMEAWTRVKQLQFWQCKLSQTTPCERGCLSHICQVVRHSWNQTFFCSSGHSYTTCMTILD